ncbi:MAG: hypothetical protein AB7F43_03990 [Bacteriovoracia bacterium]
MRLRVVFSTLALILFCHISFADCSDPDLKGKIDLLQRQIELTTVQMIEEKVLAIQAQQQFLDFEKESSKKLFYLSTAVGITTSALVGYLFFRTDEEGSSLGIPQIDSAISLFQSLLTGTYILGASFGAGIASRLFALRKIQVSPNEVEQNFYAWNEKAKVFANDINALGASSFEEWLELFGKKFDEVRLEIASYADSSAQNNGKDGFATFGTVQTSQFQIVALGHVAQLQTYRLEIGALQTIQKNLEVRCLGVN